DRSRLNPSVASFPVLKIGNADEVVSIPSALRRHVYDYCRPHQLLQRKLIDAETSLCKVHGRVEMCPAVFSRRIAISRVEITLVRHAFKISFKFELFCRGPVNAVRVERISKIDDATRGKCSRFLRRNRNYECQ